MSVYKLQYWNIRGLVQPIRYLLEYTEQKYEFSSPAGYPQWLETKAAMASTFAFPNLPNLSHGDVHITESTAIIQYIARQTGCVPKDLQQHETDMIVSVFNDLASTLGRTMYCGDDALYAKLRGDFIGGKFPLLMGQLEAWLQGKAWFGGSAVSFVDMLAYERLAVAFGVADAEADCATKYPNIARFRAAFAALPAIATYLEKNKNLAFNGPSAKWQA